jgi:hypothetical protein
VTGNIHIQIQDLGVMNRYEVQALKTDWEGGIDTNTGRRSHKPTFVKIG